MTDVTRRSLLAAVGVATAGCLSGDGPGGEPAATDPGGTTDFGGTTDSGGTTVGGTPRTESRERTTGDSAPVTTDAADETTSGDWVSHASNEPDPDHAVTLANRSDAAEAVRVRVVREETDETVFEATESVDPGVELDLYNLKQADPEGIEGFEICGELVDAEATTDGTETTDDTATTVTATATTTASDRRDCATVRTNECYASAHVTVGEDGSLQVIYAIC